MWKVDKEGNLENTHQSLVHCPRCDIFETIVITYLTKRVESWGVRSWGVRSSRVRSSRVQSSRVRSLSIWSRVWRIFSDTNIFQTFVHINFEYDPLSRLHCSKRFFSLLNLLTVEYFQSRRILIKQRIYSNIRLCLIFYTNLFGYLLTSTFWYKYISDEEPFIFRAALLYVR